MAKTVPKAALILFEFIRKCEVGTADRAGYDVIIGFRQKALPKPLTSHRLDELLNAQKVWIANWKGSAAGAYQIIRKTLLNLAVRYKLKGEQLFDVAFQNDMAWALIRGRGLDLWMKGQLSDRSFSLNLCKEWASLPVLYATEGAHRTVQRGESFYAGGKVYNKATVDAADYERVLARAKAAISQDEIPTDPAPPLDTNPMPPDDDAATLWAAVVKAAADWFAQRSKRK